MAFVLVAASGMVRAYASGSSGTKKAKVQTITAVSYTHLDVYKRQLSRRAG